MRGKPDAVTAAIMYGDELGLGPMQALAGIDVVEGKPRPSAELARALILRDGHTLTVHEATGSRVRLSGLRAGRPENERVYVEWTMDMARAAGLVNRATYRAYPRAMLMARASSDLSRILFPDVIKGLGYIAENPESLETLDGWAGPDTDPPDTDPAPPKAIQRRKRPGGTGNAETGPAPVAPGEPPTGSPELPPEAGPPPEPTGEPPPVTDAARRALFGAIGKLLGGNAQRAERLALCAAVLGRPVESSSELGPSEVSVLLDWLDAANTGRASWTYDAATETGRVEYLPLEPPRDVDDVPLPEPPRPTEGWDY